MKRPPAALAKALKALPANIRVALELSCDGDWSRVTLEADGSFKTHNQPQPSPIPGQAPAPRKAPTKQAARPADPLPVVQPRSAQPAINNKITLADLERLAEETERELAAVNKPSSTPPAVSTPAEPAPLVEAPALEEPADWDTGESPALTEAMAAFRPSAVTDVAVKKRSPRAKKAVLVCERCGREGHLVEECRSPAGKRLAPKPAPQPEEQEQPPISEPGLSARQRMEAVALQARKATEAAAVKAEPAKHTKAPAKRAPLRTRVDLQTLAALVGTEAREEPAGVSVVKVSVEDKRERAERMQPVRISVEPVAPREFSWVGVDLPSVAVKMRDHCAKGLPAHLGYDVSPDVLALYGQTVEDVDAALRFPDRVEVRPETFTKEKGYTVLGFHRGDMLVVLGMRVPTHPMVIASYLGSRLEHDTHRVGHVGGGGAKRGDGGLPKSPNQLITRLRAMGAEVANDGVSKTVPVLYKGRDLGSVTVGGVVQRASIESDYQRIVRRIDAIDRRGRSAVSA